MGSIRSVTAAAGVSVVVVALLGLPATAWAAPPSVTTDVNSGQVLDAGTVTLGGTAFDDVAVSDVQVALRDGATGQWLQDDSGGSWGPQYRRVSTELVAPGAPATEWSIDLDSLPPGTYGFHPVAVDDEGELTPAAGRPWRGFVVQDAGNQPPNVSGHITAGEVVAFGAVAPTGNASDDGAVASVEIAVRDRDTGEWLTDLHTFAAGFRWVAVDLDAPGVAEVTWSYPSPLPVGRYGYLARATDDQGAATEPADRPWTNFEIQGLGGADDGYLTIQFGRSQWAQAHQCNQSNRVFDLGAIADYLGSRGLAASSTAAMGHMSENPNVRNCPWQNEITSSWNDLAELRADHTWTVIGDSQPIYNASGAIIKARPKMSELDPGEQYRQSCGSLEVLEANGYTRAWGMFAYAGNRLDLDAQNDIVSTCYSFSRRYSALPNALDAIGPPWLVNTYSVPGGNCNDATEACYDQHLTRPGWSSRHYLHRDELLEALNAPSGTWRIVQFYRLVEGSRLEPEAPNDANYWDCSSSDPAKHWTSKDEFYCAEDFRWAIDNLDADVRVVDAAFVAELIGRGNPGG